MSGKQRYYTLRPSRMFALSILLLCLTSLVAIWMLPLHYFILFLMSLVVLVWGGYHLSLDAHLRMPHSCVAFRLEDGDEIVLVMRNGRHVSGSLSADSLVTPYVVILNVVLKERRSGRSLLVLPDSMGADRFRRLRVTLMWGEQAVQDAR